MIKKNLQKIKNIPLLDAVLLLSFFISGCSALIYQVSWQRALYGLIGVDMDSITIIVSVFMLGTGSGLREKLERKERERIEREQSGR